MNIGAPGRRAWGLRAAIAVGLSLTAAASVSAAEEPASEGARPGAARPRGASSPRAGARGAPVVLVVGSLPPGIDEAELRALLSRELGAPVLEAAALAQDARGTLHIDAHGGEVTARFEEAGGAVTQRTVRLPAGRARARSTLVALSGNVARDEAAELRAELLRRAGRRHRRDSAELPEYAERAAADSEAHSEDSDAETPGPPSGSRDLRAPPDAAGIEAPAPAGADPRARRPAAARRPQIVCNPDDGRPTFGAGADFVPMLGSSLVSPDAVLGASLNVLGGVSGGVRGAQVGSLFNLVRGAVCGVEIGGVVNVTRGVAGAQLGGVANVTGDVAGAQLGGVVNVARDVAGAQLGGVVNVARGVAGAQLGGVANVTGDVAGAQLGGVINVGRDARGLRIGGVLNVGRDVVGVQLGGVVSAARDVRGLWISGVANVGRDVAGAQIGGVVNVARDVRGLQIGTVNVAGRVRGVQIGAVNVAEESDVSIGALSIVRNGRSHLAAWGGETGLFTAAFKHGGRHFHNYYGAGILPFGERPRVGFTFGMGGHFPLSSRVFIDVDALVTSLHRTDEFAQSATLLAQLRPMVGVRIFEGLALALGPSLNASFAGSEDAANLSALGSLPLSSGSQLFARAWPGASVAVQVF